MQNKDQAWKFIKYCVSERENTRFVEADLPWDYTNGCFAVTKRNMKLMAQHASDGTGFSLVPAGFVTNVWQMDVDDYLARLDKVLSYPWCLWTTTT